jgi:simple sugar transport system ATP-binding protein
MVGETRPTQVVKQPRATSSGEVILDVRDLDVRDERGNLAVAGVSLAVYAGEILGIAGVQGNGQTQLVEALAGLRHPVTGSIVLQGADVTQATPRQLAAYGVAHIPEDRHKHGMVEGYTIADNLVLNTYYQRPFAHRMVRHADAIAAHAARLMQAFDIRAPHSTMLAGHLSGGNQQKMVIARSALDR